MKMNFILTGLGDSGGIRVVKKYAEILNKNGIDAVVYCPVIANNLHRYSSSIKNIIHQLYCTVKTIPAIKEKQYVKWVPYISNGFIRDADFTIATLWPTAFKVAKLEKSCGEKWYFIQGYEIWDNEKLGLMSYELPLNKVVVSSWINQKFKRGLGIGPFPVVWNGIDIEDFNPEGRTKHEGITFLLLNHTMKSKGVFNGLEAFKRIQISNPEVKLRMFGMCSRDNIPSDIEYIQNPTKEELVALYRDTDYFIYPSIEEGWGLTPVEAMACGCVVIGTNTGFVLDLGKHEENMMISEPCDIDGMVRNIKQVIEDRSLYHTIQRNAIELTKKMSWDKSCETFVKILCKEI